MNKQSTKSNTMPSPAFIVQKGPLEQIRFTLASYKGHPFIDVRAFYEDNAGAWKPTPKGVTIPLDMLEELEAAVAALRLAVEGEQNDGAPQTA